MLYSSTHIYSVAGFVLDTRLLCGNSIHVGLFLAIICIHDRFALERNSNNPFTSIKVHRICLLKSSTYCTVYADCLHCKECLSVQNSLDFSWSKYFVTAILPNLTRITQSNVMCGRHCIVKWDPPLSTCDAILKKQCVKKAMLCICQNFQ